MTNSPSFTRRTVLAGAAAVGATTALVACASADPTETPSGQTGQNGQSGSSPVTLNASEVPVGGGTIMSSVVVTQPTAGEYKAFSAVCPHQGCLVTSVQDAKINCSCHNSSFSAADGSVLGGPATRALASRTVTVNGDQLTIA